MFSNGSLPGVYERGLIDRKTVMIDGKQIFGVYNTNSGIDFLKEYEADAKRLGH